MNPNVTSPPTATDFQGTLPVANGGTGTTTSTGTGSTVLSASPILTGTVLLGLASVSATLTTGSGASSALYVSAPTGNTDFAGVRASNDADPVRYAAYKTRSTAAGAPATTHVNANDAIYRMRAFAADGTAYELVGNMQFLVQSVVANTSVGTWWELSTATSAGAEAKAMAVDQAQIVYVSTLQIGGTIGVIGTAPTSTTALQLTGSGSTISTTGLMAINSGGGAGTTSIGSNSAGTAGYLTVGTTGVTIGLSQSNYITVTAGGVAVSQPFTVTSTVVFSGLAAAGAGTALVITGGNSVIPLASMGMYKDHVRPIEHSERVWDLLPSSFRWGQNSHTPDTEDIGLIAEDVARVYPELATYKDGKPYGVKYMQIGVPILAEMRKLRVRLDAAGIA